MEHNAIQWLGAPSCQRGSFAFYKSVSSRAQPDGPVQVWKLGEFYFVRCGPQEPVCIAEVTLLWEDQTQRHLLASARLYFLPEDTPKGRTREHGEDEVLAVSRKMVLRVEDLVRWSCSEPTGWIDASNTKSTVSCGNNGVHKLEQNDCGNNNTNVNNSINNNNTEERSGEPLKDKSQNLLTDLPEPPGVKVLSYPQYCRFRSLQRRIQDGARDPGLQDLHLLALGGLRVLSSTRLMYCRDTFNHPTLESTTAFTWQFSPGCQSLSLRGRPRKRRGRDSRDSPNSGQSESWLERMKENVMGSVETGCEGSWLPHPEEQLFLDQLFSFMERSGAPIHKVPNLGFKKIDLFLMYSVVKRLGGYKRVTAERLWKVVYNELGGCPGSTSAATCTRRHYERLMLPYEQHLRSGGEEEGSGKAGEGEVSGAAGGEGGGGTGELAGAQGAVEAHFKIPNSPVPFKPRGMRGRKPLPRGRRPGGRGRERKIAAAVAPPSLAGVNPNGPMLVVKRGRGRPPGTRNKSTLMAQARLNATSELLPNGRGGPPTSTMHRAIQPALLPLNLPLTPDLSPLSTPFITFPPKPKDMKSERVDSGAPVLFSSLPRHFVGGSLGGFSPIKGVCPLDVFRSRMSVQRGPETPALTPQEPAAQHHPVIYTLQPKNSSHETPHQGGEQLQQHPNRCSGCDEGGQRAAPRDGRSRPSLPPLRVLPLNLDCSVQVCQLMRTRRLDSSQLQTFTRRLSEALSQDLSSKPPCSPITPPPEQALPLNLSKRFATKRPACSSEGSSQVKLNGDQPSSKRPASSDAAEDFSPACGEGGWSGSGSGGDSQDVELKNQEEPADLSSPSRIRAFLLGLPPFQVKLEEDLNVMRFGKFLPPGSGAESLRADVDRADGAVKKEEEERMIEEQRETERMAKLQKTEVEDTDAACF